ncbi:nitrate reductase associated protein [cf. Phormidesmis sp. LEGE 11477]|uniref:nitrate reductase associated protein n=1 Tax=cf. Phormidesmis sp. LEGE 11477 TaxID=1828680 RepID=UPI001880047E|nr:nitrate reductase associated protein [cf. Phormidesmis sp. LEGE 11477]MBE9059697.1 nitrate reductase associated protein [cf. Phormidesmis sp. LEGE 11477]
MASPFFEFEQDFVGSLRCIPMVVRHHLDTCGVKLKLEHWNHFTQAERQALVDWPCQSAAEARIYKEKLQALITAQTGTPAKTLATQPQPPWADLSCVPKAVCNKFAEQQVPLTLDQWAQLSELQRFALIKLSRPSHENKNFIPAVKEFGLI